SSSGCGHARRAFQPAADSWRALTELAHTSGHLYQITADDPRWGGVEQWSWLFLDRLGADRLKVCPLEVNGGVCGQLFLARRAQKFCARRHAATASWLRYLVT